MLAVPHPEWLDAANGDHRPRWKVDLLDAAGAVVLAGLPFIDGSIDLGADFRTDLSIDVPTTAVPGLIDQLYIPTGGRLRASYRIDPWPTWMTVADLDMTASAISRPENVWTLAASDQTRRISADDGARGGIDLGTETYAQAITNLIRRTFPTANIDITGIVTTLPIDIRFEYDQQAGDPWAVVQALCLSAGAYAWQHPANRTFFVRDLPTGALADPVDTLAVGEGGNAVRYTLTHEMSWNSVALTWVEDVPQNPQVVTGRWTDTRADSPVAVQRIGTEVVVGDIFDRVDPLQMPSQAQADAAAAAWAATRNADQRKGEVVSVARPWLQPFDVAAVTWLGGPTAELHRIESVGIGLSRDGAQVTRFRTGEYSMDNPVP